MAEETFNSDLLPTPVEPSASDISHCVASERMNANITVLRLNINYTHDNLNFCIFFSRHLLNSLMTVTSDFVSLLFVLCILN